jgi:hypothetical protein
VITNSNFLVVKKKLKKLLKKKSLLNTMGDTDLELPLSWGDFGIQTGNL